MVKKLCLSFVCAAIVAGCAPTGQKAVARLSDTPVVSGGKYTSGGGISVAADVRESNGSTLVCGVWAESRAQSVLTRNKAGRVVSKGSVFLGNERIAQNFLFMNKVEPSASYAGQEAGCLLLDRPWSAADAQKTPLIRIPRQLVYNDGGGDFVGGGFLIYFNDTGRPEAGI
ncbi:MAG: hypothetical protein AAGF50_11835 [Pseudomonadota bacterium]